MIDAPFAPVDFAQAFLEPAGVPEERVAGVARVQQRLNNVAVEEQILRAGLRRPARLPAHLVEARRFVHGIAVAEKQQRHGQIAIVPDDFTVAVDTVEADGIAAGDHEAFHFLGIALIDPPDKAPGALGARW